MRVLITIISVLGGLFAFQIRAQAQAQAWKQSYDAGYLDRAGAYAGGSEIMHLVAHQGKLYAANGYWMDARWVIPPEGQKQSAQVLRLDTPGGQWQVDLDTGQTNGLGLDFMKGNVLKSVTFTRDVTGSLLPSPRNLLVMASGANFERGGAVSVWVRNDGTGTWTHSLVRHGSSAGGVRWVPRDMEVHRDKVTGIERLFLSLGNPGIVSGVYDEEVEGAIRWDRHLEFPFLEEGSFRTRPLGMTRANGSLYFSEGGAIHERMDGAQPHYRKVLDLHEDTDTDVGGIRGLTVLPDPDGKRDSLLFLWAPGDRSPSQIKRLDPDGQGGFSLHDEVRVIDLMRKKLGVEVTYTLGAHNMMYPVVDPVTGKTVHIIGFQGNIRGKDELRWKGSALYAGALYALRRADRSYEVMEVNNAFAPGMPVLVSPRAFCLSPFQDGVLYVGGHDASRKVSDDMAWIYEAPLKVALGHEEARSARPKALPSLRSTRLTRGPIYELRIYSANEGRHGALIRRFREHTERIFRKHGLESVGYWIPTEGPAKKRRRFVYLLKHPSRYAAYCNWVNFFNDREWEAVLDQPEFQGLLSRRPESIFLTENDYSAFEDVAIGKAGGVYELRTCVAEKGKLAAVNERFREHTMRLYEKHGMRNIGAWTPFDRPGSSTTLVHLLYHASRESADLSWRSFLADQEWEKVRRRSEAGGPLLVATPERIYLRALGFSVLK